MALPQAQSIFMLIAHARECPECKAKLEAIFKEVLKCMVQEQKRKAKGGSC